MNETKTTEAAQVRHLDTWAGWHGQGRATVVLICGAMLLALLLRLTLIGAKSLWLDEIWSLSTANLPWTSFFWSLRHQDPNMSVYHVLLHMWRTFGHSEAFLRTLSAIFGAATVPLIYTLGTKLSSRQTGMIASYLFAINAFHVQWSQELRSYSLVVMLVTASSLLFLLAVKRSSPQVWLAYSAVSILAVYAHLFAGLVLTAHAVALLLLPPQRRPLVPAFASFASIGVFSSPLLALFYLLIRTPFNPLNWMHGLELHDISEVFHRLSGRAEIPGERGGLILLVTSVAICFAALALRWRRRPAENLREYFWPTAFLLLILFLPVTLAALVSLRQVVMQPRYMLICLPALVILLAQGIAAIRLNWARAATLVLLVILSGDQLIDYYNSRVRQDDWRAASARLLAEARPGDAALFCAAPGRLLFEYYAESNKSRAGVNVIYPQFLKDSPRNLEYLPPLEDSQVAAAEHRSNRVWVVLYHDRWPASLPVSERIQAQLSREFSKTRDEQFGSVRVILLSKNGAQPSS